MGAVRPITTPTVLSLTDDDILKVDLVGFTFWGYDAAHIGNNGGISFHPNTVGDNAQWDDLNWEYGWTEPLDPDLPNTVYYGNEGGGGWSRYYNWVGLFPLLNDACGFDDVTDYELSYGFETIEGKQALLVTWNGHAPLGQNSDFLRNIFQCVMYEDDTWEFNYDKVEWTTPYDWFDSWDGTPPATYPGADTDQLYPQIPYFVHSIMGYRMVTETDLRHLVMTWTGGSGTLTVGDVIALDWGTATLVSIDSGGETDGTGTFDLTYGQPISKQIDDGALGPFILSAPQWNATWVSEVWGGDGSNDTVDEIEWSRSVTTGSGYPIDWTTGFYAYQLADVVDGGADAVVSGGPVYSVPGRYLSAASLNFVPHLTVDVQLEGTLTITGPASVGGEINVIVIPVVAIYYYVAGQTDVDVSPDATIAWLGSADMESTLTIDVGLTGSDYREYTTTMPNYSTGGYWQVMKWYDNGWGVDPSTSIVGGDKSGTSYTWGVNPQPGNLSYLASIPLAAESPYWLGLDITLSVWAYVPSGNPPVKLQATTEYYPEYAYLQGTKPTVLSEMATTNQNTWQELTVTITAAQMATLPYPRFRIMHDQGGAQYYLAEPVYTFSGPAVSLSTVEDYEHPQTSTYSPNASYSPAPVAPFARTTGDAGNAVYEWGYSTLKLHSSTKSLWIHLGAHSGPDANPDGHFVSMGNFTGFQNLLHATKTALRFSAWVYVPGGYPAVKLGLSTIYPSAPNWRYAFETVPTATSTKWDEWERLEVDLCYPQFEGAYESGLPSGYYLEGVRLYVTQVNHDLEAQFFVDDWGYEQIPVPSTWTQYAYSVDEERGKASVVVDMEATAYDNDVRPDLELIDIDVDMGYGYISEGGSIEVPVTLEGYLVGGYQLISGSIDAGVEPTASLSLNVTLAGTWNSWSYNGYRPPPNLADVYPTVTTVTSTYHTAPDSYQITYGAQNGQNANWLAHIPTVSSIPLLELCGYETTVTAWVRVVSGGPVRLEAVATGTVYPHGTFWQSQPPVLVSDATTTTANWEQLSITIPAADMLRYPPPNIRIYHDSQSTGAQYQIDDLYWTFSGQRMGAAQIDSMEYESYGNYVTVNYQYYREGPSHNYSASTSASFQYANTQNPRTGAKSYKWTVAAATDPTKSAWCLLPGWNVWQYTLGSLHSMKVGVWVYVTLGSSPVALRVAGMFYDTADTTHALDYDIVAPVVSTKVEEWEYLEITQHYAQRNAYAPNASLIWNPFGTLSHTAPRPVLAPLDPTIPSVYYIDDMAFSQFPVQNARHTLGVQAKARSTRTDIYYSMGSPIDSVSAMVDLEAEAFLMPPFEGTIDIPVDSFQWVPVTVPVEGSIGVDVQPAKSYRALARWWDIPDNPSWQPTWDPYELPGFEGMGNYGEYDADNWDSYSWGDGLTDTWEWYMAYPWDTVYQGSRSMKVRFPADPAWPGYYVMEYWAPHSEVCIVRIVVWVYVPQECPRLVMRALTDWGTYDLDPEESGAVNGVFNPENPRVYSTTKGQWEKLVLVVDPRVPGNESYGEPYYWNNYFYIGFELFPEDQKANEQIFYVDNYEVFFDKVRDPKIIYLETR